VAVAALAGLPWWPSAVALVGFGLVTLPAAVAIFAAALKWALRSGRLTRGDTTLPLSQAYRRDPGQRA
jgi:hypothetical protein